eukprot:scaffold4686_cov140-Amphora_coffeaeformis.AAC.4
MAQAAVRRTTRVSGRITIAAAIRRTTTVGRRTTNTIVRRVSIWCGSLPSIAFRCHVGEPHPTNQSRSKNNCS